MSHLWFHLSDESDGFSHPQSSASYRKNVLHGFTWQDRWEDNAYVIFCWIPTFSFLGTFWKKTTFGITRTDLKTLYGPVWPFLSLFHFCLFISAGRINGHLEYKPTADLIMISGNVPSFNPGSLCLLFISHFTTSLHQYLFLFSSYKTISSVW